MGKLFGTDGVRGMANRELTARLAFKLGQAGAHVLTLAYHKPRILVGRDTRISGDMLEAALVAGICSVGAEAMIAGVVPTPAVAYLTRHYGVEAGVVISASHNSMEYNGIKFFDRNGYKLPDELEDRIEAIILEETEELPQPVGGDVGEIVEVKNAVEDYITFLKGTVDVDLGGLNLVADCANGAAYQAAPRLLRELGASVQAIYNTPDGTNINDRCGSTHTKMLQATVVEAGADMGLAFDGDADRLIAVDEHGQLVDGDQIMLICALDMKASGTLVEDTVVTTVMSNMGLDLALKKASCPCVKTQVGDRYVLEEMRKSGYNLGGEQSGHLIFLDHNTTGDGILTALKLLSVVKHSEKTLSELAGQMERLPQVLVNAKVSNGAKDAYMDNPDVAAAVKKIEKDFHGEGRVLIRPSGTEPLVRVMIEGRDQAMIEEKAVKLAALIEEKLG
jgi:phosphoglucosamine mutase